MITIKFNNPNSRTLTTIAIYRADDGVEIPDEPTEPPIAVLDGFADVYVDHDVEEGKNYNYRFKVYRVGGDSIMSDTEVLGDVSLYGPGGYTAALSGSNDIWEYGDIHQNEYLPSFNELEPLAGPLAEYIGWSGSWRKFRIGSDIYFMPAGGAIHIHQDDFPDLLNKVYKSDMIDVGYCTYQLADDISPKHALELLDGRVPTLWSLRKEHPRQDALEPYAGKTANARLIYGIYGPTSARVLAKNTVSNSPTVTSYIDYNNYKSYDWYWKPIFRFYPKQRSN